MTEMENGTTLGAAIDNVEQSVNYLLRELEFQVDIETKARDRTENMVQYLLTTVAAIIGAALLIIDGQRNIIVVLLLATLLIALFTGSTFYRFCRLLYVISCARMNRYKIRQALIELGIREASLSIKIEGNPNGFSSRMMRGMWVLAIVCSLLSAMVGMFILIVLKLVIIGPTGISPSQITQFVLTASVFFITTLGILILILNSYKRIVDRRRRDTLNIEEVLEDFDL